MPKLFLLQVNNYEIVVNFFHISQNLAAKGGIYCNNAKLLLLKLIHLFAREVLLVKKLEIEETKTT